VQTEKLQINAPDCTKEWQLIGNWLATNWLATRLFYIP